MAMAPELVGLALIVIAAAAVAVRVSPVGRTPGSPTRRYATGVVVMVLLVVSVLLSRSVLLGFLAGIGD
jgi:hypothetical protein